MKVLAVEIIQRQRIKSLDNGRPIHFRGGDQVRAVELRDGFLYGTIDLLGGSHYYRLDRAAVRVIGT